MIPIEKRLAFAEGLDKAMAQAGYLGHGRLERLRRKLQSMGLKVSKSLISYWAAGVRAPTAPDAATVLKALEVPEFEALRLLKLIHPYVRSMDDVRAGGAWA
ncbi:MAG: hypothetical protein HOP09_14460 [Hyphomicrobium sp.]|nr:hypothetical protein [Hyphomicrobium sp.]